VKAEIGLAADSYVTVDWPAPSHIVALTTTRIGGISLPPYDSFNQAYHVGDDAESVLANRLQLLQHCPDLEQIQWLDQIHSAIAVPATADSVPSADASYSDRLGVACAVMTADCLPLLVCDKAGQQVAAIHAGWRGLQAGVIDSTLANFNTAAEDLLVWLGPAISQPYFEVGGDVRLQFMQWPMDSELIEQAFVSNPQRPGHYFADLYQLARLNLQALGVSQIYGGDYCSFADSTRFYSYRREAVIGRMVSMIYKRA
jgi:YfiH family protein